MNTENELVRLLSAVIAQGSQFMSVGFIGQEALEPLKNMLKNLHNEDQTSKQIVDGITSVNTRNANKMATILDNLTTNATSSLKEIAELNKEVSKKLDNQLDDKKTFGINMKQFAKVMEVGLGVAKKLYDQNIQRINSYHQLEKASVVVQSGFDSLYDTASNAGMKIDDFNKVLTQSSPVIAKLNATMGDGVTTFSNLMAGIDDNLLLSHEQQAQLVDQFTATKSAFSNMNRLQEEDLKQEMNEYAKNMKALAIATGKSVESIMKETDLRNASIKVQALFANDPESYKSMKNMGFTDQEIMDLKLGMPSESLLAKQQDPTMAFAIQKAQSAFQNNEKIDNDMLMSWQAEAKSLGLDTASENYRKDLQQNIGMLKSDSPYTEGLYLGQAQANAFYQRQDPTARPKNDQDVQKSSITTQENFNKIQNEINQKLTASVDNQNALLKTLNGTIETLGVNNLAMAGAAKEVVGGWQNFASIAGGVLGGNILGKLGGKALGMFRGKKPNIPKATAPTKVKAPTPPKIKAPPIPKPSAVKGGAKVAGKAMGKAGLKKLPFGLGAIAGGIFAVDRMMDGDIIGGLMEIASGVASIVPIAGTALSVGIDSALYARDMIDTDDPSQQEQINKQINTTPSGDNAIKQAIVTAEDKSTAMLSEIQSMNHNIYELLVVATKEYEFNRNGSFGVSPKNQKDNTFIA